MNILDYSYIQIQYFLLMFFRIAGLVFFSPVFGASNIPTKAKIVLVLILTWVCFNVLQSEINYIPVAMGEMLIFIIKEFLIGMSLGLCTLFLFLGAQFAGQLIGLNIGFAIANVVDPLTNDQVSIVSTYYYMLTIMVFLVMDGYYIIIEAIFKSFRVINISTLFVNNRFYEILIEFSKFMFIMSVKLSAPTLVSLFIVSVGLGFLARTVPQMNVFMVGFPVKIFVGMIMMAVSTGIIIYVIKNAIIVFEGKLDLMLGIV